MKHPLNSELALQNTQPVLQNNQNQSPDRLIYNPSLYITFENMKKKNSFFETIQNAEGDTNWNGLEN